MAIVSGAVTVHQLVSFAVASPMSRIHREVAIIHLIIVPVLVLLEILHSLFEHIYTFPCTFFLANLKKFALDVTARQNFVSANKLVNNIYKWLFFLT